MNQDGSSYYYSSGKSNVGGAAVISPVHVVNDDDDDAGSLSSASAQHKGHHFPHPHYYDSRSTSNTTSPAWSSLKGLVGQLTKNNHGVVSSPVATAGTAISSHHHETGSPSSSSSTSPYDDSSSSPSPSPTNSPPGIGGSSVVGATAPKSNRTSSSFTASSPISPRTYYRMRQRQKARHRQEQQLQKQQLAMKEHNTPTVTNTGPSGTGAGPQHQRRRVLIHHGHGTSYHDGTSSGFLSNVIFGNNRKQGKHHPQQQQQHPSLIYSIVAVQLALLLIICLGTLPYMLTLVHYSHSIVHDLQHGTATSPTGMASTTASGDIIATTASSSSANILNSIATSESNAPPPSVSSTLLSENGKDKQSPLSLDDIEALPSLSKTQAQNLIMTPTKDDAGAEPAQKEMSNPSSVGITTTDISATSTTTTNLRGNSKNVVLGDKSTSTTSATSDTLSGKMSAGEPAESAVASSAITVDPPSSTDGTVAATITITDNGLIDDPNIAPNVPLVDLDLPLLHIVNSRFMQDQAELLHLAKARLDLFETFCFPGLAGQTIQPPPLTRRQGSVGGDHDGDEGDGSPLAPPTLEELKQYRFLWLLKVDPELDEESLKRLIELMEPHPNFFVLGSNINYGIGVRPGSWRGGEAGAGLFDESETTIYTGSIPLLKYAHAARESKIVVETRLDADDGLPFHYLEAMGNTALQKLSPPGTDIDLDEDALITSSLNHHDSPEEAHEKATWLYWCAHESINWYPTAMYKGLKEANVDQIRTERDPGRYTIDARGHDGHAICLTPGLSSGLAVGVTYDDMPHIGHFTLMHDLPMLQDQKSCGLSNIRYCLHVVDMRPIRSRTPTSAGMKNLQLEGKGVSEDLVEKQWNYVKDVFGITKDSVFSTNLAMQENLIHILQDNYQGQCTAGHSCKKDTKTTLLEMIRVVGGQEAVDNLPSKLLVYQKKALKQQQEGENQVDLVDRDIKEYKQKLAQQLQDGIQARMKAAAEKAAQKQKTKKKKTTTHKRTTAKPLKTTIATKTTSTMKR